VINHVYTKSKIELVAKKGEGVNGGRRGVSRPVHLPDIPGYGGAVNPVGLASL
jgi:hypothetical protein